MDDKKKKFMIPETEIVNFTNEEIITISATDDVANIGDGENEEDY